MKIFFDMDGLSSSFICGFKKQLEYITKINYDNIHPVKDIISWDLHKTFSTTEENVEKTWDLIQKNPLFWENLPILNEEDFYYFRDNLNNKKHIYDIYFLTNRMPTGGISAVYQTQKWLETNGWKNPNVIVAGNKGDVVKALQGNFFIDDSGKNCEDVLSQTETCQVRLMDYPHNKKYKDTERLKRVHSLKEFTNEILNKG